MSDSDLLYGLLAFQNELVNRQQLIQALKTWRADSDVALEQILVEQNALEERDRPIVARLVELHVERHGDVAQSLNTLTEDDAMLESLRSVLDSEPTIKATSAWLTQFAEQASSRQPSQSKGQLSQRFNILERHAEGGLGVVFTAEDRQLNRKVAVKQIKPLHADMPAIRSKFNYEALVTGKLEHPSVVPVYACGEDHAGRPYYAMKFIQGESLKDSIQEFHRGLAESNRRFDGPELRRLLRRFIGVCEAISYAHSRGILHRDIKPSNVMLGKFGETLVVDWGLAKSVQPVQSESDQTEVELASQPSVISQLDTRSDSETAYGSMCGTPEYAPPEQLLGRLDEMCPASDVFSLGAVLTEILTGKTHLKRSTSSDQMIKQLGERNLEAQFTGEAPRALVAICCKATALKIPDRYSTVEAFKADVQRWLDDEETEALPDSSWRAAARWGRAHRTLTTSIGLSGVVGAILTCILWVLVASSRQELAQQEIKFLAREGRFGEAAASLESLRNDTGLTVDWQLTLANYYLRASEFGDVDRILGEINKTKFDRKQDARFKLLNGDLLLASTNHQQGKTLLREALESKLLAASDAAYAEAVLAQDSKSSLKAFNTCLTLDPLNSNALLKRGLSHLVRGNVQEALADVGFAKSRFPKDEQFLCLSAACSAIVSGRQGAQEILDGGRADQLPEAELAIIELLSATYDRFGNSIAYDNLGTPSVVFLKSIVDAEQERIAPFSSVGLSSPQVVWMENLYSMAQPSESEYEELVKGGPPERIVRELGAELPDNQWINFLLGAFDFQIGDFRSAQNHYARAVENDALFGLQIAQTAAWMNLAALEGPVVKGQVERSSIQNEIVEAQSIATKFAATFQAWDPGLADSKFIWRALVTGGLGAQADLVVESQLVKDSLAPEERKAWETRKAVSLELAERVPKLLDEILQSKSTDN